MEVLRTQGIFPKNGKRYIIKTSIVGSTKPTELSKNFLKCTLYLLNGDKKEFEDSIYSAFNDGLGTTFKDAVKWADFKLNYRHGISLIAAK